MRFEKRSLANLEKCYSVNSTIIDGIRRVIFASEGSFPAYMFSGEDFLQTTVWDKPGGTMSMVFIDGFERDFLAIQNFIPTFKAEEATIVWAHFNDDNEWVVKTIAKLPFVHRFDVISTNGINYLIAATLCSSKKDTNDWSDAGKIYVATLPTDINDLNNIEDGCLELTVLKDELHKNHGYWRGKYNGKEVCFFTCEEGVFSVVSPNGTDKEWKIEQIFARCISDICAFDIDEDGKDELITIEPFHGGNFIINKKDANGEYKEIYRYPYERDFGHVVWGGLLRGKPTILGGFRRPTKDFFYIQCESKMPLTFKEHTIDMDGGPANICVICGDSYDTIAAANREQGEATVYFVKDDEDCSNI